jgi:DNA-binding Lrp family transcriptional regulator
MSLAIAGLFLWVVEIMGRRSDIDWEMIEKLYRAGQLTIRQIAAECKVGPSSIVNKAKREGWVRNLSDEIRQLTKAKIAQIDAQKIIEETAQKNVQQTAQTIKNAVEEASNVAAGVIIRHRTYIGEALERAKRIERILDGALSDESELKEATTAAAAMKQLVEARKTLIALERQAYSLDDDNTDRSQSSNGPTEIKINLVKPDET